MRASRAHSLGHEDHIKSVHWREVTFWCSRLQVVRGPSVKHAQFSPSLHQSLIKRFLFKCWRQLHVLQQPGSVIERRMAGLSRKAYREKWRRPYIGRWHHVAFIICDSGHHGSATPAPASATPSHLYGYSVQSHRSRLSSEKQPSRAVFCRFSLSAVTEKMPDISVSLVDTGSKRQCKAADHRRRCGTSSLRCGEGSI